MFDVLRRTGRVFVLVLVTASPLGCFSYNSPRRANSDTDVRVGGKSVVDVRNRGDDPNQAQPQAQPANPNQGGYTSVNVDHTP